MQIANVNHRKNNSWQFFQQNFVCLIIMSKDSPWLANMNAEISDKSTKNAEVDKNHNINTLSFYTAFRNIPFMLTDSR